MHAAEDDEGDASDHVRPRLVDAEARLAVEEAGERLGREESDGEAEEQRRLQREVVEFVSVHVEERLLDLLRLDGLGGGVEFAEVGLHGDGRGLRVESGGGGSGGERRSGAAQLRRPKLRSQLSFVKFDPQLPVLADRAGFASFPNVDS